MSIPAEEANGLASAHAWLKLGWTDHRLAWDPNSYDDITVMRVNTDDIWMPDIELYNGVRVTKLFDHKTLLYSNGYQYSLPTYQIEFKCPMNLRYFPYDEQKCTLKYGSWTHDLTSINITTMSSKIDLEFFNPSADLVVRDATPKLNLIQYPCCAETYGDVTFTVYLTRNSQAYSVKLVLPSVLTGFMILLTFLLPPASHEKITLCGIIFLALLLLLVYLQSVVPASGDTILGEYMAFALFIDFFATILAVVSYHLHVRKSHPVKKKTVEGDDQDLNIHTPAETKRDWLQYLDLVSFVIFSIVFVVGLAIMLGRRG
ncbi:neuronal acetylcholine receptor subunit alpha-6-like [Amphiura filiformis]|uniref:neuronal acetylcholine receptor subunit alpha-6-like n=1 Tax=Amphiura filiformis TaxID=82378 RepID=UPI003B20F5E8